MLSTRLEQAGRFAAGVVVVAVSTVGIAQADPYTDCGIAKPDPSQYQEVTIVDVIGKKIRVLDPATRKSTRERIPKSKLKTSGTTIRDAFGLICLQRKDGSGPIWAYSSTVKYRCVVKKAALPETGSGGGTMGIGKGGCEDDEW